MTNARVLAIEPRRRRATGPGRRARHRSRIGGRLRGAVDERSGAIPEVHAHAHAGGLLLVPTQAARAVQVGALPVFMIDDGRDFFYGFPDFGDVGLKCGSHYGTGQIQHADLARQDASAPDENHTRDYLERYMPEGAGPLLGMKTCLYTMTPDTDFIIDTSPEDDRIVVVSPCSGHGFKFAGVVGEIAPTWRSAVTRSRTSRDSASTDFRPEGCAPHSPLWLDAIWSVPGRHRPAGSVR